MKIFIPFLLLTVLFGCKKDESRLPQVNMDWEQRTVEASLDSLSSGSTYLSIYSQINSYDEETKHGLTVTVSMRNIYDEDTLYMHGIRSYDTEGHMLTDYISQDIYILPLETLEIIIDEEDDYGGTGGNFIFDWSAEAGKEPFIEAVMIRSSGQQGISFTTRGIRRD